jgi:hypothetical protein
LELYGISTTNGEQLLFSNIFVTVEAPEGVSIAPPTEVYELCAHTKFIDHDEDLEIDNYKVKIPILADTVSLDYGIPNMCNSVLHLIYDGAEIPANFTFGTLTVDRSGQYYAYF